MILSEWCTDDTLSVSQQGVGQEEDMAVESAS